MNLLLLLCVCLGLRPDGDREAQRLLVEEEQGLQRDRGQAEVGGVERLCEVPGLRVSPLFQCNGQSKVPVTGDCGTPSGEAPVGKHRRQRWSVLGPGAAAPPGSAARLCVAVTATGMDKSSIGHSSFSKTTVCTPSERNY